MNFQYYQHTHVQVAQHHQLVAHMLAVPIQIKHLTLNHRHQFNHNNKLKQPIIFSIPIFIR